MQDAGTTAASLIALKALGLRLAIDDFGTGYSSLSYLRQFPIDTLKIDQSFAREITAGSRDDTIVGAIISMGKSLKQRVIGGGGRRAARVPETPALWRRPGLPFQPAGERRRFRRAACSQEGFRSPVGGNLAVRHRMA